jgi:hypothetical protein
MRALLPCSIASTILTNRTERYTLVAVSIMFLLGIWLLCRELLIWQGKRNQVWRSAPLVLCFSERLRSIRMRFQPLKQSTDQGRLDKAA